MFVYFQMFDVVKKLREKSSPGSADFEIQRANEVMLFMLFVVHLKTKLTCCLRLPQSAGFLS